MSEYQRAYPIVGNGKHRPPDYARVVRSLSDAELRTDLEAGRGDDDYRAAARGELERRQEEER